MQYTHKIIICVLLIALGLMAIAFIIDGRKESFSDVGKYKQLVVRFYCPCKKCINVPRWRDGKFASGKRTYFGGICANKKYPFGTMITFDEPILGQRIFCVEDRGPMPNKWEDCVEVFIPYKLGGHKKALELGKKYMMAKIK